MAIMDTFIAVVAAPAIQTNLHASDADIQLILAGYQLVYAIALITGARLGDMVGRKRMFLIGMALFTVSSAACAIAPNVSTLIGARLVQGLSAALMFPQVFAFIQVLLPAPKRHLGFSALGAVIGTSTTIGQLLGGLLIDADLFGSGWRPVFWINVPIGLAALALGAWLIPESRSDQARRLDLAGVAVLTLCLTLVVLPLTEGRELGWPAWTFGCLAVGAALLGVFVLVEQRVLASGRAPLVAPAMFRERSFAVGIALVVVAYAGINSFFLVLSLTLQDGFGLSALGAGVAYTPLAVAFFVTSLIAGRLGPARGRRVVVVGSVVALLGFVSTLVLVTAVGPNLPVAGLVPTLLLVGAGNGLLLTPLLNTVVSRVAPHQVGMASGVLSTGQQIGGALGVALIGVLYFGALPAGGPVRTGTAMAQGYSAAFALALVFTVGVGVVVGLLLFALPKATPQTPRRSGVIDTEKA